MSISIINANPEDRGHFSQHILDVIRSNADYVDDDSPKRYDEILRYANSVIRELLQMLQNGSMTRERCLEQLREYVETGSLDPLTNGLAIIIIKRMKGGADPLKMFSMDRSTPLPKRLKDAVLVSKSLPASPVEEEELDEII